MAYNKAEEEKKWKIWKVAEEDKLRRLGVSQESIDALRQFDRSVFNSNRRFYQRIYDPDTYIEDLTSPQGEVVSNVETLLDSIENEKLYQALKEVDKLTLHIVLLKMQGYETKEIAHCLHMTTKAVYRRMDRLKEKLKRFSA